MPNRNRQLLDIGAGIVTILLAILVYVDSASIKVIADTTLDARFYPKFLAVLMILLSLIMILRAGIQLSRAENSSSGSAKENKHAVVKEILPAAETLLLLGLYVFAHKSIGFSRKSSLCFLFRLFSHNKSCTALYKCVFSSLFFCAVQLLAQVSGPHPSDRGRHIQFALLLITPKTTTLPPSILTSTALF